MQNPNGHLPRAPAHTHPDYRPEFHDLGSPPLHFEPGWPPEGLDGQGWGPRDPLAYPAYPSRGSREGKGCACGPPPGFGDPYTEGAHRQQPSHMPVDYRPASSASAYVQQPGLTDEGGSRQQPPRPRGIPKTPAPRIYAPHLSQLEAIKLLNQKNLIMGTLRVSAGRTDQAFVSDGSSYECMDILIPDRKARNRAIHGDDVLIKLLPPSQWQVAQGRFKSIDNLISPSPSPQTDLPPPAADDSEAERRPTGEVVHIVNPSATTKVIIAVLRANQKSDVEDLTVTPNQKFVRAMPLDRRYPWILIPVNLVKEFHTIPGELEPKSLYRIKIDQWGEYSMLPVGRILAKLGQAGDMDAEEEAAMVSCGIGDHMLPFTEEVTSEADQIVQTTIDNWESLCTQRTDFRKGFRVFTIDPVDARDFDDAIHIKTDCSTSPPTYEVGVHIADVAHFVKPDSAIDDEAKKRCTTVYLPRLCYPMLPRALCDQLCSLRPQEQKLTFSVVFRLKSDGSRDGAFTPRIQRSIIESCCRFNYEEVQNILDQIELPCSIDEVNVEDVPNIAMSQCPTPEAVVFKPDVFDADLEAFMVSHKFKRNFKSEGEFDDDPEPPKMSSGHSWPDLVADLKVLEVLTQRIRSRRFLEGSLAISRSKLILEDIVKKCPAHASSSSHELIEELMLTANTIIAEFLVNSSHSNVAVLRNHSPPSAKSLQELGEHLTDIGIPHDLRSSKSAMQTMVSLFQTAGPTASLGIEDLFMKIMNPAEYIVYNEFNSTLHYALNFPLYSHFTSPIRRYADVMVHRVLSVALDLLSCSAEDKAAAEEEHLIKQQCTDCNIKRVAARDAQERCNLSAFCIFLAETRKAFHTLATPIRFDDHSLVIFLPDLGKERRIMYDNEINSEVQKLAETFEEPLAFPHACDRRKNEATFTWTDTSSRVIQQNLELFSRVPVIIVPIDKVPIEFKAFLMPPWHPNYRVTLAGDHKEDDAFKVKVVDRVGGGSDPPKPRLLDLDVHATLRHVKRAYCDY